MRRHQTRGAEAGDGTQAKADDRDFLHRVGDEVDGRALAKAAGQIGAAGCLNGFDRSTTARSFDQANDRHAEPCRQLLRHFGLTLDRGIG